MHHKHRVVHTGQRMGLGVEAEASQMDLGPLNHKVVVLHNHGFRMGLVHHRKYCTHRCNGRVELHQPR